MSPFPRRTWNQDWAHLEVLPALGLHVRLAVRLVLQPLRLLHHVVLVVEGLVLVAPLEVGVVDALQGDTVNKRTNENNAKNFS